jgi:hypothetical protein
LVNQATLRGEEAMKKEDLLPFAQELKAHFSPENQAHRCTPDPYSKYSPIKNPLPSVETGKTMHLLNAESHDDAEPPGGNGNQVGGYTGLDFVAFIPAIALLFDKGHGSRTLPCRHNTHHSKK